MKSAPETLTLASPDDDDDDFQNPSQAKNLIVSSLTNSSSQPLSGSRPRKRPKPAVATGKENRQILQIPSSSHPGRILKKCDQNKPISGGERRKLKEGKVVHYLMSIESRLLESRTNAVSCVSESDFEPGTQLNDLASLCCKMDEEGSLIDLGVECPLCGTDITGLSEDLRQVHTNDCLDKDATPPLETPPFVDMKSNSPRQVDANPVLQWLRSLNLSRYEGVFIREEIDWETLQSLTEEDAFRFLTGDCSHWFLTHFHIDHYQGLTRNFCYGKIYCSSITAHLVNLKIGVPWDRLHILPLNQKITIGGVSLTCLDANHCPGSIVILFEPSNGKAVLHTGDFRFSAEMTNSPLLQSRHVHTLILDTTYCNPQYDFPKQEAVIQFVIEAIQAEAFNPKTLFLIGTYTIGKERLFIEVARLLKKKIYVGQAKLSLLRCLELPEEDMQWFTAHEMESHIHVVPLWTIASFKRMKHISNHYAGQFDLIVAFSPTGWTFGKGKKKTPGRRWQQGTVIRYEVPYSEHCSFSELREFVQFISPERIIPSVNNDGPESADSMIALLMSDP